MVLVLYATRLLLALLLALPIAGRAGALSSGHPDGDLVFFEPGGLYLLEALRLGRFTLPSELARIAALSVLAAYLGLLPLAASLHALAHPGKLRLWPLLQRSLPAMGTLSLLLGLALASHALLATLALAIVSLSGAALDTREGLLTLGGILAATLLLATGIGVLHDLARAEAVARDARAFDAIRAALRTFGARPWLAWAGRTALGLGLVALSASVVGSIGVERNLALVAVAIVHQLTVLALVALRFSWLAFAMRALAGRTSEPPPPALQTSPR